ncbi:MAG: SDR family NAD(P)-dependent oxidoreductase [Motiliproteus sp.]|nr:SDR family NAD(P)-dependent oxidoreductase [Motiliproteus sp.]MCW9053435.1 SDR family NAD(P)-dependent oxidoreductase [Motiliproteus sp.]
MKKSILITGCSSGIGLKTAKLFQQNQYRVIASARTQSDVEQLQQLGLEALLLDLNSDDSIHQAAEQCLEWVDGRLDAVFHNGAYGQPGALEDLSREALRQQFETNLFGWHELNRLLLPSMRKAGSGRIVFNSSVLGLVCMPYRGAYNASKFAVEAYADTLRLELWETGIAVVLVEPGPITGRFRENAYQAFQRHVDPERSAHRQQYGRMIEHFTKQGPTTQFTLGPETVADKVLKAVESKRPKHRYYVTLPTYLFAYLKRLLPTTAMDELLRRG